MHLAAVDQEREIVEHMLEFKWATVLTHIGVYVCICVFELERVSTIVPHAPFGFEILTYSKQMDVASQLLVIVEMISL